MTIIEVDDRTYGMSQTRRRFLLTTAATTGALTGLAGCTTGGTGGDTGGDDTPSPMATPSPTAGGMGASATLTVRSHPTYGEVLGDADGRALYLFTPDGQGESVCYDQCADAWPPLTTDGEPAADDGVTADLGTTERDDGSMQVTAGGWPLYYFAGDSTPEDAAGQELGNVWFLLRPDGSGVYPTVSVREHDQHGQILTDADGMTQYMFTPDSPGQSVCTGGCAEAWPPLVVDSEDELVESVLADLTLGTTERDDGSLQVTADEMPLYYWVNDEEPGDATGQEVNNVWFVLRPDASVLKPSVSVREHDELGRILTDADGMTLYLFTNDEGGMSSCTGGCADAWPPLLVGDHGLVESVLTDVELGTTEHPEAGPMVTAAGHPLYYFAQDEEPGDANGQGLNDVWYVLDAEGKQVGGQGGSSDGGY